MHLFERNLTLSQFFACVVYYNLSKMGESDGCKIVYISDRSDGSLQTNVILFYIQSAYNQLVHFFLCINVYVQFGIYDISTEHTKHGRIISIQYEEIKERTKSR